MVHTDGTILREKGLFAERRTIPSSTSELMFAFLCTHLESLKDRYDFVGVFRTHVLLFFGEARTSATYLVLRADHQSGGVQWWTDGRED